MDRMTLNESYEHLRLMRGTRRRSALWPRVTLATLVAVAMSASWVARANAQSVGFTKIADSSDTMPGGGGTFKFMFDAAISGDLVVFYGVNATFTQFGIYTGSGGALSLVANKSTAVPGGVGTYSVLSCPTISGTAVNFIGKDSNAATGGSEGLFTRTGAGAISVIANQSTSIPNTGGLFTDTGFCTSRDGATSAFRGARIPDFGGAADRREGVYSTFGGLHAMADKNTAVPGGTGTFNGEPSGIGNFSEPALSGNNAVFRGRGTGAQEGFYFYDASMSTLSKVVDKSNQIPGHAGVFFNQFNNVGYDFDGTEAVFIGYNETGGFPNQINQCGIFVVDVLTGSMTTVAQLDTTVPGTAQTFGENGPLQTIPFQAAAISGGNVLFTANESAPAASAALFLWEGATGALTRILGKDDAFDSKTVLSVGIRAQGGGIFDDDKFVISVGFSDSTSGIYRGAIDPPSCEPDNNDPTIACPDTVVVDMDIDECFATGVDLGMPVADDFCEVDFVMNDAPIQFPAGDTIVTWTVQDTSGRTATCEQTVTVADGQDPMIGCPADVNLAAPAGTCEVVGIDLGMATVTDNCPGATASSDAPMNFPIGETTVTWTATDAAGNTSMCTQTVTIDDVEAPSITCPADLDATTDAGECFATIADLGAPTASDLCGGVALSNDAPATFPLGDTFVTWTATDDSGNVETCMQRVTITDGEAPTIDTCPANRGIDANANCEATVPDLTGDVVATDSCDAGPIVTQAPAAGAAIGLGDTQVVMSVTDNAGNVSTCTVTLTVNENGCNDPGPGPGPGDDPTPGADGIDDATEDGAPNNGDGNNDGTPDSQQDNVASLPNADGNYLTIVALDGKTLTNVVAGDNPSPGDAPAGVAFPLGFVSFEIPGLQPGEAVEVQIIADLPAGATIDTYWRYGPEPDNTTPHWYEFLFDGTTGAELNGNSITLHLVDGSRGDDDVTANGVIVDPGAPATAPAVVTPQPTPDCGTGTCAAGSAMFVPLLLVSMGLAKRRRRRGRSRVASRC